MSLIGETKQSILLRLREEPAHGYDLAKELDISSGYVYQHLQELQDEGMIEVYEDETEGRQRTSYHLTENGELLLKALGE
ncbi:ArsR family transcriptional regulator [Natrarchaeobius halalkaliphilus]|uniref:ArsR family transcriptional regulator n=1 Tax=Natrarchaeobius halalkaliphilus TaxID=1679091 RepID=A0A3N6P1A3_9EURY|nr:helix-turn-helix transcriptional regulator [Natrarchaeobius halalkaliphilus]RQG88845.1 ArsR family transcriptional regulator [Natrarchaeobius halalkaliphilus]